MGELRAEDFREFFKQLHGYSPFPWQEELAARVCTEGWREIKVIDLPTASGKTACIDIALFALAVGGKQAPRRIFFVVDRRVVVNEAFLRVCKVRKRLKKASDGVLYEVAQRFRAMACGDAAESDAEPLLVSEMRGGAFRDESWVTNPLQPAVIASTVDQVGSRLLFRGYGVRSNSWPLHAGLIGNDALILLDEAHCSRAFAQTLERVEKYRGDGWASRPLKLPFHFVEMTATPSREVKPENRIALSERDLEVEVFRRRLEADKPTQLIEIKGRKNDTERLLDELEAQATALSRDADARRVVIFVNRVKTAKRLYERLRARAERAEAVVELVIGSMRPVDREDIEERLRQRLKSGERERTGGDPVTYVVSTQCLEVGADLDFDVLVTECASIDALLQRFGRLDRLGEFGRARAAIVISSWQIDPKQPDPVYGEALSKTWAWLKQKADEGGRVNMGILPREDGPATIRDLFKEVEDKLSYCMTARNAAILLPAHVDLLSQTSPVPSPDPAISLFLHGRGQNALDVQVVWRKDLEDAHEVEEITAIVELCPPSSREAMSVSVGAFRNWFAGEKDVLAQESDVESGADDETPRQSRAFAVLAWDGEDSALIDDAKDIKPGQTLVVKASAGGWDQLGYIPPAAPIDVADRAAFTMRRGVTLRLHPEIIKQWPECPSRESLIEAVAREDAERDDMKSLLDEYLADLANQGIEQKHPWPQDFLNEWKNLRQLRLETYPHAKFPYVIRARRGGRKQNQGGPVLLNDHLAHVEDEAGLMAYSLDESLRDAVVRSARLHDWGKVDVRFQAWLRNGEMAARYSDKPLAKSGNDVLLKQAAAGLPKGFRHELLSLLFAEKSPQAAGEMRDLILHLVAAHHGRCRPFAPVIPDEGADCVSCKEIAICKQERIENAPHRLGRGVPDRFWRLTAAHGWWGLAYLEGMLRLADWKASDDEAAEVSYE